MKTPGIWTMKELLKSVNSLAARKENTGWFPCRPQIAIGWQARWKAAWLVFTGKADAVIWPEGQ